MLQGETKCAPPNEKASQHPPGHRPHVAEQRRPVRRFPQRSRPLSPRPEAPQPPRLVRGTPRRLRTGGQVARRSVLRRDDRRPARNARSSHRRQGVSHLPRRAVLKRQDAVQPACPHGVRGAVRPQRVQRLLFLVGTGQGGVGRRGARVREGDARRVPTGNRGRHNGRRTRVDGCRPRNEGFHLSEPDLQRVPSGFDKAHPREAFLRRKGVSVWRDFESAEAMLSAKAVKACREVFQELLPVYEWVSRVQASA